MKKKLTSQPTDHHYTNEPTVSGRRRKPFNSLTGSSLIHLIHPIKRILHKIGNKRIRNKMNERLSHLDENVDDNPIYRC